MTEYAVPTIEVAIKNLQSRRPKPRGRRQALAPYVDQLRQLIAEGWSRSEIVAEVNALGGKLSPALLRDVLKIAPPKVTKAGERKQAIPIAKSPLPPAPKAEAMPMPPQYAPADDAAAE